MTIFKKHHFNLIQYISDFISAAAGILSRFLIIACGFLAIALVKGGGHIVSSAFDNVNAFSRISINILEDFKPRGDLLDSIRPNLRMSDIHEFNVIERAIFNSRVNEESIEVARGSLARLADFGEDGPNYGSVLLLPTNDRERLNVYGMGRSYDFINRARRDFRYVQELSGESYDAIRLSGADDLLQSIRSSEYNIISIISHSEKGILRAPDGTSITIDEVAFACEVAQKVCILLSCESARYVNSESVLGIRNILSFREAFYISQRMRIAADINHDDVSYNALIKNLEAELRVAELAINIREGAYMLMPLSGGFGLYHFFLREENSEPDVAAG